ncbi:hypothetical protein AM231_03250 [Paenibacillus solani]|uniref:DUF2127 domain-containing protein n=1 Tax=Paenibacillus solani TaxID=1705565 RepID=A0A0M1P1I4_9BACL|nr:hypothetical protein AM231_03250 [Paenibacillus solani]
MRIISVLMIVQGVFYLITGIGNILRGDELLLLNNELHTNFNYLFIVIGFLIVLSGLGIWFRREFSYLLTLFIYGKLILYSVGVLFYSIIIDFNLNFPSTILLIIVIIYFTIVFIYTKRNYRFK